MAAGLMRAKSDDAGELIVHQLLHGYSEGHRLLEGSLRLPDDLTRLTLRMSDLSGSSLVHGFEEYLTGYPLPSLAAYAFAKTWYAPEMPRPGCVWTHTLVLPHATLAAVQSLGDLLTLAKVVARFTEASGAVRLKSALFGPETERLPFPHYKEGEILFALSTCSSPDSFQAETLHLEERGRNFWSFAPAEAQNLVSESFHAPLNALGEKVLSGLVSAFDPGAARAFAGDQPTLLPMLFRVNPSLAASVDIWPSSTERQKELFDAVSAQNEISPQLVRTVVLALLAAGADVVAMEALSRWDGPAVEAALEWAEDRGGILPASWRRGLAGHPSAVLQWLEQHPDVSVQTLTLIVRALDPRTDEVRLTRNAVWVRALDHMARDANASEVAYFRAFLLTVALAHPEPLPSSLIALSFKYLHRLAALNQLAYDAWLLFEPWMPDLEWIHGWDKCERLRQGLVQAFLRHNWPIADLLQIVSEPYLLGELKKSAKKVDGGKELFRELTKLIREGKVNPTGEQWAALKG
jgi:GTPase-associated protein 1, N-terminal domain type 1